MKISTKLIVTGAASLVGVALAVGGAYAATGSLTVSDSPGQVLQVSGVGPASMHASATAKMHANANAKGIFGTTATATETPKAEATETPKANSKSEQGVASSPNTTSPAEPRVASKDASTVKGSQTGKEIEAWAHTQGQVETVAPEAAVSVDINEHASVNSDR